MVTTLSTKSTFAERLFHLQNMREEIVPDGTHTVKNNLFKFIYSGQKNKQTLAPLTFTSVENINLLSVNLCCCQTAFQGVNDLCMVKNPRPAWY